MIVFDLDGTLIDSSRDLANAVSELVTSYGAAALAEADVVAMIGDGAATLVARALDRAGLDPALPGALDRFLDIYDHRLLDHTMPYEGMHEVLALLVQTGPLGVLTNKPLGPTERILDALGLRGFFAAVVGGDGPHPRKPDPTAIHAMAAPSGRAVLVGDSPVDAATAAAGGYPFVLASYGFGAARFDGRAPDGARVVGHPRELAALADTRTFDAARVPIVIR